MKRNAPALIQQEEVESVTPAQRVWLERASEFSRANQEVEDWSFLKLFANDSENSGKLIEHYWDDKP